MDSGASTRDKASHWMIKVYMIEPIDIVDLVGVQSFIDKMS